MPICAVYSCSNRPGGTKNTPEDVKLRFYNIPKIRLIEGEQTKQLSEERRRLWKAAINRKDIKTDEAWQRKTIVCSRHFVDGECVPSSPQQPSWLPTLHLDYDIASATAGVSKGRFSRLKNLKRTSTNSISPQERKRERKQKPSSTAECDGGTSALNTSDAVSAEDATFFQFRDLQRSDQDVEQEIVHCAYHESDGEESDNLHQANDNIVANPVTGEYTSSSTQTDLNSTAIQQMISDLEARLFEAANTKKFCSIYERQCYSGNDTKVSFYTGVPNLAVFDLLFQMVSPYMSSLTASLSKEQEFFLCLIKLKMNYPFQDIAYQLNVSVSTVQRSFHRTLDVLETRLSFLIKWPEREDLRVSMPMSFRESFGSRVSVIVDCFEIRAEKPSGAANQIQTFSNYKHYQTVKYLIGITPQGTVSFISEAWGGRASDKHIIEQTGLLQNLLPGDILMADRGFNISDEVMFYQAELAIPNFTHGKKQLHPLEVENTRKIASVRIHVERIIGFIRRKFGFLQSTVPIEFMKNKNGKTVPTIDKMVKVCCCLANLRASIVPFD